MKVVRSHRPQYTNEKSVGANNPGDENAGYGKLVLANKDFLWISYAVIERPIMARSNSILSLQLFLVTELDYYQPWPSVIPWNFLVVHPRPVIRDSENGIAF